MEDAARGELKEVYEPVDSTGKERKPSLQPYPAIPWETLDLDQFNLVPRFLRPILNRMGANLNSFRVIPIESGRGCPYGCEFCTVTGFFGDSIRFRSNESVVDELLRLKARARSDGGKIRSFSLTITSPSTSSERNRCCGRSSTPTRSYPGSRRSAPTCCATKNLWT